MAAKRCKVYELISTPMIHTPGVIRWLQNAYRTQPRWAEKAMAESYAPLPRPVVLALLKKKLQTEVVGETLYVGWPVGCHPREGHRQADIG